MPIEQQIRELEQRIFNHEHNGNIYRPIYTQNLVGEIPSRLSIQGIQSETVIGVPATIATTGSTDCYVIVPFSGNLVSVDFSAVDALAANDTNYITFSITNIEQSGTTALLAATDANTTKATGGTAISAHTRRGLTLHGTASNLAVNKGDRLRIRAAATGTLANTVTFPVYLLRFSVSAPEISTVGNTDFYCIAPISGNLISVDFSATTALATSDTNYITFTITNLGQGGAGTAAMLAATDANTTKATGGTAITANDKWASGLTLNATPNNTQVVEGDRLLIRVVATGTLANSVTFPTYMLRFL